MGKFIELRFSAAGCVALALMLLLLPLRWILAWFAASAFHEVCHALAVKLCGGDISTLRLGVGGAEMAVAGIRGWREWICALAGPLGALVLLLFARWIPAVAVCALFQSAYNLLPLYPLDGGRALKSALEQLTPARAQGICNGIGWVTIGLLWLGAAWAAIVWKLGIVPILFVTILCLRTNLRKIPCNTARFAVQ